MRERKVIALRFGIDVFSLLSRPFPSQTYMLSNLLQELALAREHGRKRIVLDESRLTENPVDRLSRMISQTFWHNLTRRIDGGGLETILSDQRIVPNLDLQGFTSLLKKQR